MLGGIVSSKVIYPELSFEIMRILFEVNNDIGYGYKEKHYQKILEIAFKNAGLNYKPQCPYSIRYQGQIVGRYYMDFVIESKIILEIKVGNYFSKNNINQVYGYLVATRLKLGILANFTRDGIKFKRIVNIK
ncbi:MAG: GxxExxY protein [Patescibacteria group bacterium]